MNLSPTTRRDIWAGRDNYFMVASSAIGLDSSRYNQMDYLGSVRFKNEERKRERGKSNFEMLYQARDEMLRMRDELKTHVICWLARVRRRHWPTLVPRLNNECDWNKYLYGETTEICAKMRESTPLDRHKWITCLIDKQRYQVTIFDDFQY